MKTSLSSIEQRRRVRGCLPLLANSMRFVLTQRWGGSLQHSDKPFDVLGVSRKSRSCAGRLAFSGFMGVGEKLCLWVKNCDERQVNSSIRR
jgi:hypothetical protein